MNISKARRAHKRNIVESQRFPAHQTHTPVPFYIQQQAEVCSNSKSYCYIRIFKLTFLIAKSLKKSDSDILLYLPH